MILFSSSLNLLYLNAWHQFLITKINGKNANFIFKKLVYTANLLIRRKVSFLIHIFHLNNGIVVLLLIFPI